MDRRSCHHLTSNQKSRPSRRNRSSLPWMMTVPFFQSTTTPLKRWYMRAMKTLPPGTTVEAKLNLPMMAANSRAVHWPRDRCFCSNSRSNAQ